MEERSGERVEALVTAAVRAAAAWSKRDEDIARAWREVSRMTGVANFVLGPGRGLDGPTAFVEALHRPLSKFAADVEWTGEPLGGVPFIDEDGQVASEVHEWAGEYLNALFHGSDDPGRQWLPKWSWQRAEQVEREFNHAIRSGTEKDYETTRQFVIEHPTGDGRELLTLRHDSGALPAGDFGPIPFERSFEGRWWACPRCRWPMRISGLRARCDIRGHEADFDILAPSRPADAPTLRPRSGKRSKIPTARSCEGASCVSEPIWRYITVPGLAELKLRDRLEAIDGVKVDMWPGKDTCDLRVRAGGKKWDVDVKDHARAITIIDKPPSVEWIVVPDERRSQVRTLKERLPDKRVFTSSRFVTHVKNATGASK
jgi:hypothetical protein